MHPLLDLIRQGKIRNDGRDADGLPAFMLALGRLLSVISTLTFLWMVYEGTLTLNIITSDTSPTVQAGKPMIVHGDDPAPLSNSEGGAFSSRPFPAP